MDMSNANSLFYKIIPVREGTKEIKSAFISCDEELDEESIAFKKVILSNHFLNGIETIEKADVDDIEFQEYVNTDLEKIQHDIDRLTKLKCNLIEQQKIINKGQ